jgi:hypothetical protein
LSCDLVKFDWVVMTFAKSDFLSQEYTWTPGMPLQQNWFKLRSRYNLSSGFLRFPFFLILHISSVLTSVFIFNSSWIICTKRRSFLDVMHLWTQDSKKHVVFQILCQGVSKITTHILLEEGHSAFKWYRLFCNSDKSPLSQLSPTQRNK